MKLSLGLIAKNEVSDFSRILKDYATYFDEIVIAVDEDLVGFKEAAKGYPQVKIIPYIWQDDFSHKRNLIHKAITGDYYLRIDMDDMVLNPERLRKEAEDAKEKNLDIVYFYYLYSHDAWGNCNAAHWRESLIKKTDNLYWNKKIHENLLPKNMSGYRIELNDNVQIKHLATNEHINKSVLRNIKYLLEEYKQDKEKTDPRTISYLGRMLHGIGQYEKAIFFLEKHIATSGWDEDRYYSWCSLSDCYRRLGKHDQALAAAFEALEERPDYPDAYLKIHDIYFDQENWVKALEWGRQGMLKPLPKTFLLQDPSAYGWLPTISMAHTLFELNKFDDALKMLLEAKKEVPSLDYIVENEPHYRKAVIHKNFMEKFLGVLNFLKDNKEEEKIENLLDATPKDFSKNEIIIKLKHHYRKPKSWAKNEVVFYCGGGSEFWSPKSVAKGIGGSEEAVIVLTKELAKLGWKVTVFNECGEDEGIYDGVTYKNVIEFNPSDRYNILVSWRVNIFTYKIQARNKIVWLHDLPVNMKLDENECKSFDKIVVLSNYHKSTLPKTVPEDKIFVSTNGINPADFVGIKEERQLHRVIYASSYDRGLEQLLGMWKDVRKEVPDAELHIYYGWNTYDRFVKGGMIKEDGFKERMLGLIKQEGVFEHGRIGHKELLKEYAKSGVLAYPCTYAGEINCIALTKAIASGCMVVSNDFAVLGERNPYFAVPQDKFLYTLLQVLKGKFIKDCVNTKKYIQDNSWESVAKDWIENLFPIKVETEVIDRFTWIFQRIGKEDKIVDIGANKGHVFYGWDRKRITSVDIDKYEYEGFVQADAAKLPFADKSYDVAVLAEIVEHTPDPIKVLTEANRVAKKVLITVPYEHEWDESLDPFKKIEDKIAESHQTAAELARFGNPEAKEFHNDGFQHLYHHTFYTPELLKEHLGKAGFKDIKITKIRIADWCWLGAECL